MHTAQNIQIGYSSSPPPAFFLRRSDVRSPSPHAASTTLEGPKKSKVYISPPFYWYHSVVRTSMVSWQPKILIFRHPSNPHDPKIQTWIFRPHFIGAVVLSSPQSIHGSLGTQSNRSRLPCHSRPAKNPKLDISRPFYWYRSAVHTTSIPGPEHPLLSRSRKNENPIFRPHFIGVAALSSARTLSMDASMLDAPSTLHPRKRRN